MHTFFLRNMYLENNLTKPDSFSLCGVPIDLTQIDLPTYIFAAREDHIVPWKATFQTTKIVRGRCDLFLAHRATSPARSTRLPRTSVQLLGQRGCLA